VLQHPVYTVINLNYIERFSFVKCALISLWVQFWSVSAIPECLNCATFWRDFFPSWCCDFVLNSCVEIWTHAYCLQHFLSLMEYIQFPKLNKYLCEHQQIQRTLNLYLCLAMAQRVTFLSPWRSRFNSRPLNVEFVVGKGTLGQVFPEHVAFPPASIDASAPYSFVHLLLII
jgi:hypothetical protein